MRAVFRILGSCVVVVLVLGAMAIGWMVVTGHRPIIITTGSMRPTAPPGTLIIAGPVSGADVGVGDVVVMRREGATPVTHRVVEVIDEQGVRAVITQGDANDFLDPAPYLLGERDELVARWYLPGAGRVVEWLSSGGGQLAILGLVVAVFCSAALRRIWAAPPDESDERDDGGRDGAPAPVASGGVL